MSIAPRSAASYCREHCHGSCDAMPGCTKEHATDCSLCQHGNRPKGTGYYWRRDGYGGWEVVQVYSTIESPAGLHFRSFGQARAEPGTPVAAMPDGVWGPKLVAPTPKPGTDEWYQQMGDLIERAPVGNPIGGPWGKTK